MNKETQDTEAKPGIVEVEIDEEMHRAILQIRQVGGEVIKSAVPTGPLVERLPAVRV